MNKVAVLLLVVLATAALVSGAHHKHHKKNKKVLKHLKHKTDKVALVQVGAKAKWVESGFDQTTITENNPDANSPEHHQAMVDGQWEAEHDARNVLDTAAKHARKMIDDAIAYAREYQGVVQLHFQMPKPAEPEEGAEGEEGAGEEAAALVEKSSKVHKKGKHHLKHKAKEPTPADTEVAEDHHKKYAGVAFDENMTMDPQDLASAVKVINQSGEDHENFKAQFKKLCEGGCPEPSSETTEEAAEETEAEPASGDDEAEPASGDDEAEASGDDEVEAAGDDEADVEATEEELIE